MADFPCPSCGGAMESGYLLAESLMEGAKWTPKKTRLAMGGEPLALADTWGNVYLAGSRCRGCRLCVLAY